MKYHLLLCLAGVFLIVGCRHKGLQPLDEYLAEYGYKRPKVLRDFNGCGTVLDKDGAVIYANAGEILPNELAPMVTGNAQLPAFTGKLTVNVSAVAEIPESPFEFSGEYDAVEEIEIIPGPMQNDVISKRGLLRLLHNKPELFKELKGKIVLVDTLKGSFDYKFRKADGTALKITADKISQIVGKVGIQARCKVQDETTLRVESSYIAFIGVRITEKLAGDESNFEIQTVNMFELPNN